MKRICLYTALAAALVLAAGCNKTIDERKDLESRERVAIDVSYSDEEGAKVTSLTIPHGALQKVLNIQVNRESLRWNLISNRPWCRVLPGEHKGSGSVTLEIDANEDFQPRDAATLSFVAGDFSGFELSVNQDAAGFLIDKPFSLSAKGGETFEVQVTTEAGEDFSCDADSWLTAEKTGSVTAEGRTVTTLRVTTAYNPDNSRYGKLRLNGSGISDAIHVWQFGNDYIFDDEGNLFFPKEVEAEIAFVSPAFVVKDVIAPAYASTSSRSNDDGTVTTSLKFSENLSDCSEERTIPVSLVINNSARTRVALPKIVQDYLPAGGLMTARGLQLFAQTVLDEGDMSEWEKDGVVQVLQDIDMTGVEDWSGIGSQEHPFKGRLNGNNHSIVNLRASAPVFNLCDGAEISNFGADKTCSFTFPAASTLASAFAGQLNGTSLNGITVAAALDFGGTAGNDLYVGGIAAKADAASSIVNSKMSGRILLSSGAAPSAICHAGGIAAVSEGEIKNCEFAGTLDHFSAVAGMEMGGIVSCLTASVRASGNAFSGIINVESSSRDIVAGGLYGRLSGGNFSFKRTSDNSLISGTIHIANFEASTETRVFAGGLAGYLDGGVGLEVDGYTIMTNFSLDHQVAHTAEYLCAGGILGGCNPDEASGELKFENLTNQGKYDILYVEGQASLVRRACIGAIAGLIRGQAGFTACTNKATLGSGTATATITKIAAAKHYAVLLGGIAGLAYGGNVSFTRCANEGNLDNNQYNNASSTDSFENAAGKFHSGLATGGILGAFNYATSPDGYTAVFDNCTNASNIQAYRGFAGGIAGFAQNARFNNCSWVKGQFDNQYNSYNQSSFKGGIAGALAGSNVSDCTVKDVSIRAECMGSAENADGGGIVGRIISGAAVTLSGCSFYGSVSYYLDDPAKKIGYAAGIAATAQSNTVIRDCRIGGKVQGNSIITDAIATDKAVGNGSCTVEGIRMWDGK